MKSLRKLLTVTLVVILGIFACGVRSFTAAASTQTEPKGDLSNGVIIVSPARISWPSVEGDYASYMVRIRSWDSLALFQADPSGGGSTVSIKGITNKYLEYNFIRNHVYRIWVTGVTSTGKYVPIGGYEWEA